MANIDGTTINYSDVGQVASTLDTCCNNMRTQFEDWTSIMNRLTNADNFAGSASDSYAQSYGTLKAKFDEYTELVKAFADSLRSQSAAYQATDAKLAQAAEELPH